ncbi:MAG TPA: hypothetical protein VFD58_07280, partial [Blastocatellia bacterium]|nr:hypothetical protein [Blastocatellia bacterium]
MTEVGGPGKTLITPGAGVSANWQWHRINRLDRIAILTAQVDEPLLEPGLEPAEVGRLPREQCPVAQSGEEMAV